MLYSIKDYIFFDGGRRSKGHWDWLILLIFYKYVNDNDIGCWRIIHSNLSPLSSLTFSLSRY